MQNKDIRYDITQMRTSFHTPHDKILYVFASRAEISYMRSKQNQNTTAHITQQLILYLIQTASLEQRDEIQPMIYQTKQKYHIWYHIAIKSCYLPLWIYIIVCYMRAKSFKTLYDGYITKLAASNNNVVIPHSDPVMQIGLSWDVILLALNYEMPWDFVKDVWDFARSRRPFWMASSSPQ